MEAEIAMIKSEMNDMTSQTIGDCTFFIGKRQNKDIILVQCGIGKVNAAVVTTLLITKFQPQSLFFSGVAGAVDESLKVGDVVIARDLVQHDFDLRAFGYQQGQLAGTSTLSLFTEPSLLALAMSLTQGKPNIHVGRILSGDQFIETKEEKIKLGQQFDALCVDMESAAVAQVCSRFQTPFLAIRSISDAVSTESKIEYETFLSQAAQTSKEMLQQFISHL